MRISLSVDVEHDCPPYLSSWRGMNEGLPRLLDLLRARGVHATFFCTGQAAARYPDLVRRLVSEGHELGSHGLTHRVFTELTDHEAEREITEASRILREFADVTSFRAPNLRFPSRLLPMLEDDGFTIDSSLARYKLHRVTPAPGSRLERFAVALPPSWLRLPAPVRDPVLRRLANPGLIYVHPWEFVDLRSAPIPLDCRFATGHTALDRLSAVIDLLEGTGAGFVRIRDLAA